MQKLLNLSSFHLEEEIEAYIAAHGMKAHDRLPPERTLAPLLGVSRVTLRETLKRLCNENVLYSVQGKGTFLAPEKVAIPYDRFTSFSGSMEKAGLAHSSQLLGIEAVRADSQTARHLGLRTGASLWRIRRLRQVAGSRILLETSWLPARLFPGLDEEPLDNVSLYALLERRYGYTLTRHHLTIHIGYASAWQAGHLGIQPGDLVACEEGIAYDAEGNPIEYSTSAADSRQICYVARIQSSDKCEEES